MSETPRVNSANNSSQGKKDRTDSHNVVYREPQKEHYETVVRIREETWDEYWRRVFGDSAVE
jgi:hypothetical protein